jgi:hypothetical protein
MHTLNLLRSALASRLVVELFGSSSLLSRNGVPPGDLIPHNNTDQLLGSALISTEHVCIPLDGCATQCERLGLWTGVDGARWRLLAGRRLAQSHIGDLL